MIRERVPNSALLPLAEASSLKKAGPQSQLTSFDQAPVSAWTSDALAPCPGILTLTISPVTSRNSKPDHFVPRSQGPGPWVPSLPATKLRTPTPN